jgi:hypothetical protein
MGQKLKVWIKWKQNECFVSNEVFAILRKQISKGLILGLKNKYWVVVMKEEVLDKICCNVYNKLYRRPKH